jgi:hypothetical protein
MSGGKEQLRRFAREIMPEVSSAITGTATRADAEMSWIADGGHAQAKQSRPRMASAGYCLEPSMRPPTELHRLGRQRPHQP